MTDADSRPPPIVNWLAEIGLKEHAPVLEQHGIDLEVVDYLDLDDLRAIGLPLGAQMRLLAAIARRKTSSQHEAEVIAIYVENLREVLRYIQRYLVLGLTVSIFYLVLVIGTEQSVKIDKLPAITRADAELLLLAIFFVAGLLASWAVPRALRIMGTLHRLARGDLVDAVLTLPSLPTHRIWAPRVGGALLPALIVAGGILVEHWSLLESEGDRWNVIFAVGLLSVPYLILATELSTFAGLSSDRFGD